MTPATSSTPTCTPAPPIETLPDLRRLVNLWLRAFAQAAQTVVEVLEVRGSLLAGHRALAGCGPGQRHTRHRRGAVTIGRFPYLSSYAGMAGRLAIKAAQLRVWRTALPPLRSSYGPEEPATRAGRVAWMISGLSGQTGTLTAHPGDLAFRLQPVRLVASRRAPFALPQFVGAPLDVFAHLVDAPFGCRLACGSLDHGRLRLWGSRRRGLRLCRSGSGSSSRACSTPSRTRALALGQAGQSARAASVYRRGLNEL